MTVLVLDCTCVPHKVGNHYILCPRESCVSTNKSHYCTTKVYVSHYGTRWLYFDAAWRTVKAEAKWSARFRQWSVGQNVTIQRSIEPRRVWIRRDQSESSCLSTEPRSGVWIWKRGETNGQKGTRSKYRLKGLSPFHPASLPPNRQSNSPHLIMWTPHGEQMTMFQSRNSISWCKGDEKIRTVLWGSITQDFQWWCSIFPWTKGRPFSWL